MFFHQDGVKWMTGQLNQLMALLKGFQKFDNNFFHGGTINENKQSSEFLTLRAAIMEYVGAKKSNTSLEVMERNCRKVTKHIFEGNQLFLEIIKKLSDVKSETRQTDIDRIIPKIQDDKEAIMKESTDLHNQVEIIIRELEALDKANHDFKYYDTRTLIYHVGIAIKYLTTIDEKSNSLAVNFHDLEKLAENEIQALKEIREAADKSHWLFLNIKSWFRK